MASIAVGNGYAGELAAKRIKTKKVRERTAATRKQIVLTIICIGTLLLIAVMLSAASANIKLENNRLEGLNANIEAEIDAINGSMSDANNISIIEDKAINEYGMIHQKKSNIKKIDGDKSGNIDLADKIKQDAFK